MLCYGCGRQLQGGAVFCKHCGAVNVHSAKTNGKGQKNGGSGGAAWKFSFPDGKDAAGFRKWRAAKPYPLKWNSFTQVVQKPMTSPVPEYFQPRFSLKAKLNRADRHGINYSGSAIVTLVLAVLAFLVSVVGFLGVPFIGFAGIILAIAAFVAAIVEYRKNYAFIPVGVVIGIVAFGVGLLAVIFEFLKLSLVF
ncbi:MAG: hypothetical protein LBT20_08845 [Clostridiales bacterium]|jgi:hypothetical protein|nr:hypothetical protein [Clostridiales bacterium]